MTDNALDCVQFDAEAAVGVELDTLLVAQAEELAGQCGTDVSQRCTFKEADLLRMDVAELCPGYPDRRFTLVVVFLLSEAESRFMDVIVKLAGNGARILVLAFKLDASCGLDLIAENHPFYVYRRSSVAVGVEV